MALLQFVAGQWKIASQSCLSAHDQLSKEITFNANCPKVKGVADTDDPKDEKKHQCLMMRRHCAKKCKGKDDSCPAISLFTLNLKVNKDTKAFESVECVCSYSTYISSCTGEYSDTWSDVENEYDERCAATDEEPTTTSTSMTSTTTVAQSDCPKVTNTLSYGQVVYLTGENLKGRVDHGGKVTASCPTDMLVCPATLPADCIKPKATFTCNDGIWLPFNPTQCVKGFETICNGIRGKLLDGLCVALDANLRDISKDKECTRAEGGRLMTQKSQTDLDKLFDGFTWKSEAEGDSRKTYHLFVQLNKNLTAGQVLRFTGVAPEASDTENSQAYRGAIALEGRQYPSSYPQHVALTMHINYRRNLVSFTREQQGNDGKTIRTPNYPEDIPIATGLMPKENFDITIENTDEQFVIKFGDTVKNYPYVNRNVHYVNTIYFYGRDFKLNSATLDGTPLKDGDEDVDYYGCFMVGLSNKNRDSDPKVGWVWEDGKEAKPDETLWDTNAGEPDNKNGDESYACVNVKTKKLRDVSNLLKRCAVCEYEDQTKARKSEKRKKREAVDNAEFKKKTIVGQETTRPLNLEL